jgi:hypothetical protein
MLKCVPRVTAEEYCLRAIDRQKTEEESCGGCGMRLLRASLIVVACALTLATLWCPRANAQLINPTKEPERVAKEGAALLTKIIVMEHVCPNPAAREQARSEIINWREKVAKARERSLVTSTTKPAWDAIDALDKKLTQVLDHLDKCLEPETKEPQPELPREFPLPQPGPLEYMSFDGGGGIATLSLPDIRFGVKKEEPGGETVHKLSNDNNFGDEIGGVLSGEFTLPLSNSSAVAFSGFWASIDGSDTVHCASTLDERCTITDIVDDPESAAPLPPSGSELTQRTSRDVDNWGAQAELRAYLRPQGFLREFYAEVGPDFRGINQDISIRSSVPEVFDGLYKENLDTTYYGAFIAVGGEYSLFPQLASSLGLRSFIKARVGVYDAHTDYDGHFEQDFDEVFAAIEPISSRLSLSDDKATVIGGLSFETRKQFGPRTSLSLLSEYEWYSSVPEMRYNHTDAFPGGALPGKVDGTKIDYDSAFATRTMLRLNIGLGPSTLYTPQ